MQFESLLARIVEEFEVAYVEALGGDELLLHAVGANRGAEGDSFGFVWLHNCLGICTCLDLWHLHCDLRLIEESWSDILVDCMY